MRIIVNKSQYGYSGLASNQQDNLKTYIQVGFKKGEEPKAELCQIKVTNGFLSCYKKNNGDVVPKIVVMDYEVIKEYEKKNVAEQPKEVEIKPITDDMLPF